MKYEQIHMNHKFFEKSRSINSRKFNSLQRKPVNTQKLWDQRVVCHSFFINKPLQHVIDYENNNKYSQKRKIQ